MDYVLLCLSISIIYRLSSISILVTLSLTRAYTRAYIDSVCVPPRVGLLRSTYLCVDGSWICLLPFIAYRQTDRQTGS